MIQNKPRIWGRVSTGGPKIWLLLAFFFYNVAPSPYALAQTKAEFLAFPTALASQRSKDPDIHDLEKSTIDLGVDLFFTVDYRNLRILAEGFASTKEDHGAHIERLQVGWNVDSKAAFWLGRFHNPLGLWNTTYHHGSFLQTSISRPGIVEFEDESGILPLHLTGILTEGTHSTVDTRWNYAIALGAGPHLNDHLESLDILELNDSPTRLSTTLNLSLQPSNESENRLGGFVGYTEIPADDSPADQVKQQVIGIYSDWELRSSRLLGSAFYITNETQLTGEKKESSFISAYGQFECLLLTRWTPYIRIEESFNDKGDPYLSLFPAFIRDRILAGIRFDISRRQALTLEISNVHLESIRYKQATLQWSAVFP